MYRITEIALPLDGQEQELRALAAKRLYVEPERVCALSLVKKSVDGRKTTSALFVRSSVRFPGQSRELRTRGSKPVSRLFISCPNLDPCRAAR